MRYSGTCRHPEIKEANAAYDLLLGARKKAADKAAKGR